VKYKVIGLHLTDEGYVCLHLEPLESEQRPAVTAKPVGVRAGDDILVEMIEAAKAAVSELYSELRGSGSPTSVLFISYDEYNELDIKIGDIVEVKLEVV